MSYSLNSLKGGYIKDYIGTTIGVIKGDTRSLENGSHDFSFWRLRDVEGDSRDPQELVTPKGLLGLSNL